MIVVSKTDGYVINLVMVVYSPDKELHIMPGDELLNPVTSIEKKFRITPDILAEIQHKLCSTYDELRGQDNFSSVQMWTGLMTYIEGSLTANKRIHEIQKKVLTAKLANKLGSHALEEIDSSCNSTDPRALVKGMTHFFAAKLEDRQKAIQFSKTVGVDLLAILESQGM